MSYALFLVVTSFTVLIFTPQRHMALPVFKGAKVSHILSENDRKLSDPLTVQQILHWPGLHGLSFLISSRALIQSSRLIRDVPQSPHMPPLRRIRARYGMGPRSKKRKSYARHNTLRMVRSFTFPIHRPWSLLFFFLLIASLVT